MAQRFVPMVAYEDASRAAEWLSRAFGFKERERFHDAQGVVTDVVLEYGDEFFLAGHPSASYRGPRTHALSCANARAWLETPYVVDGVLVYVDDVDDHYRVAKAAGAKILSELETNTIQRQYRCEDLEGHRWMFATRI
jgi:PhnB protein